MTPPPPSEQIRHGLDELLDLARDSVRTTTADPHFALMQAWFTRCVDTLQGVLVLYDTGRGQVSQPLLRCAIEHAVAMVWLGELGGDALLAVARSHQRWAANVKRATDAANRLEARPGRENWSADLDAVFEELAGQELPEGSLPGEWKIDKKFQVAHAFDLYVAWLSETGYSHPTQISAGPYLREKDGRYLLLTEPRSAGDTVVIRCTAVAVIAFRAMGEALGSAVLKARVDQLDDELTVAFQAAKAAGLFEPQATPDWPRRYGPPPSATGG